MVDRPLIFIDFIHMDKNNIKCCFYCYGGKLQEMPNFVHRFWTIDETKAFLSISTIEKSESEFLQKNRKRFSVITTKNNWFLANFLAENLKET